MGHTQDKSSTHEHPAKTTTKIRLIQENEAEGETAAAYQYCREALGRQNVPGLLKCFGTNPGGARALVDMGAAILFVEGHLNRRQKEMIATYVSSLNACPYCLDSHGFALTVQGATMETAQAIAADNLDQSEISTSERALLRFAGKVNSESFKISDDDIKCLRDLKWREEQISEAVHVAAMMGMCNRVANAFGLPSQGLLSSKINGCY